MAFETMIDRSTGTARADRTGSNWIELLAALLSSVANLLIYASRTSLLTLLTLFARSTEIPGPCCYMLLHAATCCYMEILQREHVLFGVVKWKKMEENGSWMRV